MLAILLLLFGASISQKINIHVGHDSATGEPTRIRAFPDITFNDTIVSANDYECSAQKGCSFLAEEGVIVRHGHPIAYRRAAASINFVNKAFNETTDFYYLLNDTFGYGSVIGLHEGSKFLNYFFVEHLNTA